MEGDDKEEKSRLIQQVFSLQNTLDGESLFVFACFLFVIHCNLYVAFSFEKVKNFKSILTLYLSMAEDQIIVGNKTCT